MLEYSQYLRAHGADFNTRPSGINNQTALDINRHQNMEAKKEVVKAAAALAAVATVTLVPGLNAKAASVVSESAQEGLFDHATHYVEENWKWMIPVAAAVDGVVDGVLEMAKKAEPTPIPKYASNVVVSAAVEGAEMVTVLLAAEQVVNNPEIHPTLNTIGRVVLPFAAAYALLPDTVHPYLKAGFNWIIDEGAEVLKKIVDRQSR